MTTLTLTKLWINRLDTGEAIAAQTGRERSQQFGVDLTVRQYAAGRRRAVAVEGEAGELNWRVIAVSRTLKDQLRSWSGLAVQVRDHRGQKFYGVFAGVAVSEYMRPDLYAVSFTLQTVSFTEGV
jgi:hypothetical protein